MDRLADWFGAHRGVVALGLCAATLLACFGAARIRVDDVPRDVFRSEDEAFVVHQSVLADFGSDDSDCLLVLEAEDWFDAERIGFLRELVRRAREVPAVVAVRSLGDAFVPGTGRVPRALLPGGETEAELEGVSEEVWSAARTAALASPLVRDQLLSADGKTTLVLVGLPARAQSLPELRPPVRALQALAAELSGKSGVRVRVTGIPTIRVEIFDSMQRESLTFTAYVALAGFLTALVFFRRLAPVVLTLCGAALGAVWALGWMGLGGLPLDILTTSVPGLVMVIGLADALHLTVDMERSRAAGLGRVEAARDAIRHLGLACLVTSVTTAVGFLSLLVARVSSIRNFGLAVGGGVLLTFVAVLFGVPLVHSLLRGTPGKRSEEPRAGGLVERLLDAVLARPRRVAGVGLALTAALLTLAPRLEPDIRVSEATPPSYESMQALFHCDREFGGLLPIHVLLEWDEAHELGSPAVQAALRGIEDLVRVDPLTSEPLSVLGLLSVFGPDAPLALLSLLPDDVRTRFVRSDLRRTLVTFRMPDLASPELEPTFAALQAGVAALDEGNAAVRLHLAGSGYMAHENIRDMVRDLALGLGLASVVIFAVLTALLRSVRLGLLSLLPNVLPLAVVAAWLVLSGRTLTMDAAVVLTVCLGLAVDDTVHVLSRFRREREGGGTLPEIVRRSVLGVAPAMLVTTAVLTVGFALLMLSDFPNLSQFGELSCIGFVAALVGDLALLPALLVCFGGQTP